MLKWISLAALLVVAVTSIALHHAEAKRLARIERAITKPSESLPTFDESLLADLPEVARRYFLHAIRPGTPLTPTVRLKQTASMKPRDDAARLELTAEQLLVPGAGFLWSATAKMGPIAIHVVDHYAEERGGVRVRALGIMPIQTATGHDVTRSSRHRLAAESVWSPASLLPHFGAHWQAAGPNAARVRVVIDEEPIDLTLNIAENGALRSLSLERHGDVGVPNWRPIPYGFEVEEEGTFDGYTIPKRLRGGWWYGTERYRPEDAGIFEIESADFS